MTQSFATGYEIDRRLTDELVSIASSASAEILKFRPVDVSRRDKADGSPVTIADEASQAIILQKLQLLLPGIPVVSEEISIRSDPPPRGSRFMLVDPLDGTREFLGGFQDYTVNIALIDSGRPLIGIVAAPALGTVWAGLVGQGAERLRLAPGAVTTQTKERAPIRARARAQRGAVALISRSHPEPEADPYLDSIGPMERMVCGSSLKFCRIAEGVADFYVRMASISEWDVAAGDALVTAAGGAIKAINGEALTYSGAGIRLPPFIVSGDCAAVR